MHCIYRISVKNLKHSVQTSVDISTYFDLFLFNCIITVWNLVRSLEITSMRSKWTLQSRTCHPKSFFIILRLLITFWLIIGQRQIGMKRSHKSVIKMPITRLRLLFVPFHSVSCLSTTIKNSFSDNLKKEKRLLSHKTSVYLPDDFFLPMIFITVIKGTAE